MKEQSEKDLREKNENILRLNNILSESIGADSGEVKQLKDQIDKRVKELNDLTLVLSKRDKEIALLKKEVDQSASKDEEVSKLRDHVRALEMDFKQKKENSESVVDRLREIACNTLKLQNEFGWEANLAKALTASAVEHINFLRAVQGQRVLFMPHSPGIYIALVLK